ncbi:Aquaporin Z 2 [Stieleria bergensis]|uniref:Aquaporin Z 2 n=1 Tax=Stieleria bergensis TaxID=2528025 RepID=A0A517SPI7_9BACT|nr:Aquaporin Z 2 [Planctomycetes bacterium SV_7m_r]
MKNYLAEIVGTFILVAFGTGVVVVDQQTDAEVTLVGIALVWGLVVYAIISAIGDVSGAHVNPSVTVTLWASGRFPGAQVAPYIVCQLIGAVLGSVMVRVLFPDADSLGGTAPSGGLMQSFLAEVLLTFLLLFVVLNVSEGAKEKGITAGIAIGGVITLEVLFGGPISGASMNPARSFGPALVGGDWTAYWIYVAGPILGGLLAAPLAILLRSDNKPEKPSTES